MSVRKPETHNTATDNSTVGIQAEQVHNSTVYMNSPDMPADEKFRKGVNHLKGGLPSKASELISEAIAEGYDNSESRFYWFLAKLGKRSYRELGRDEKEELRHAQALLVDYPEDEWKQGIDVICSLLNRMEDPESDPEAELKALRELPDRQRVLIGEHLGMFLNGTLKDALWADMRDAAHRVAAEKERKDRVWAFFEPDPVTPLAVYPELVSTSFSEKINLAFSTIAFAAAFGYLSWGVFSAGSLLPLFAFPLAMGGLYVGIRNAAEWEFRAGRLRRKEHEFAGVVSFPPSHDDNFSRRIVQFFDYYFYKYAPRDEAERKSWFADTRGVRRSLQNELIELYSNESVRPESVKWLARYLVRDVRKKWQECVLFQYRERYWTPFKIKFQCCVGIFFALAGMSFVVQSAFEAEPVLSGLTTVALIISGGISVQLFLSIYLEKIRYDDDLENYAQEIANREKEYRRWKSKVEHAKPTDEQMERWLNADKTIFLDHALKEYKLAWRDIIAYTFLQSPSKTYRRARVSYGPWRYSRYSMLLFLITADGVREVGAELDFERSQLNGFERTNYRFDAVASVRVITSGDTPHSLELTLVNGEPRKIKVVDEDPALLETDSKDQERPEDLTNLTLESFGFDQALHVLEGIAAEGKQWIHRN